MQAARKEENVRLEKISVPPPRDADRLLESKFAKEAEWQQS